MGVALPLPELPTPHRRAHVGVRRLHDQAVEVTSGAIAPFESSPGVVRGFCGTCGSTLSCSNAGWPGETHYHVGAFDQAERLEPTGNIYPEERLAWLHLT